MNLRITYVVKAKNKSVLRDGAGGNKIHGLGMSRRNEQARNSNRQQYFNHSRITSSHILIQRSKTGGVQRRVASQSQET